MRDPRSAKDQVLARIAGVGQELMERRFDPEAYIRAREAIKPAIARFKAQRTGGKEQVLDQKERAKVPTEAAAIQAVTEKMVGERKKREDLKGAFEELDKEKSGERVIRWRQPMDMEALQPATGVPKAHSKEVRARAGEKTLEELYRAVDTVPATREQRLVLRSLVYQMEERPGEGQDVMQAFEDFYARHQVVKDGKLVRSALQVFLSPEQIELLVKLNTMRKWGVKTAV
jgi:hypothetical protein